MGNNTVVYQVGDGRGGISQNQLTTLPGDNTRIRTAQGIGFSKYASYYRETKFQDIYGGQTAKQQFIAKLQEIRQLSNVPNSSKIDLSWFDI